MIRTQDLTVAFGKRVLFNEVNIQFTQGHCYGLIGANGAGKSTFLKVLSGDIEANEGRVSIEPGKRMAILRQDQNAFDELRVLDTVIMGHERLYTLMKERDELYAKPDFDEADGVRAGELEAELAEMNVWEAESEAGNLLNQLGINDSLQQKNMSELEGGEKVRVLLAQALFGNPDILLMDEPTNNLDLDSIAWLEEFLLNFQNVVVVVSHDRHFLNRVCTHMADIDYGQITLFAGNYDFWYQAIQLQMKQRSEKNKKSEEKAKELKAFIARFSSNASKARQATSRKKLLDKLDIESLPRSSRKPPYILFQPERACGKNILTIEGLTHSIEGEKVLNNFELTMTQGDKIAFVGSNGIPKTTLFRILAGEIEPDAGTATWGGTIKHAYFPKDNSEWFDKNISMIDWLRQYSPDPEDNFVRGFLGRMLFSGDESMKKVNVLSGGERVRCMLSKMMLSSANALVMDEPTNHLDLESITALNNALIDFSEIVLFASHDHQFIDTIANRIIEIGPHGVIDRRMRFDDYIKDEEVRKQRLEIYNGKVALSM